MIDNTEFWKNLRIEEKEFLSHHIHDISKGEHGGYKDDLELVSRQRSIISRQILGKLSEFEIFLIRMYGRFGLVINLGIRDHRRLLRNKSIKEIRSEINAFRERFNLKNINLTEEFKLTIFEDFIIDMRLSKNLAELSYHIRDEIDRLISRKYMNFNKNENYLYRISRAKKDSYGAGEEEIEQSSTKINLGDIITDESLWSSTIRSNLALLRYSYQSHVGLNPMPIEADEEEILFMIKNNRFLKTIDISGYKFPKEYEHENAGEMLIKSSSKFRVVGIQKTESFMHRRIVVLDPVNPREITKNTILKNAFDGTLARRLWVQSAIME